MREILFRGKLIGNGKWAYGNLSITQDGVTIITPDDTIIGKYGQVIPETVGQYTGLTDKNGEKIFEGDIVKDDGVLFGEVIYATPQNGYDGIAGFMVDDIDDGLQNYNGFWHLVEVIGNAYDNSELLKGGAEE